MEEKTRFPRWNKVPMSLRDLMCTFMGLEERLLLGASSREEKKHLSNGQSWHSTVCLVPKHGQRNFQQFFSQVIQYYPANRCLDFETTASDIDHMDCLKKNILPTVERMKINSFPGMRWIADWSFAFASKLLHLEIANSTIDKKDLVPLSKCPQLETLVFTQCAFRCWGSRCCLTSRFLVDCSHLELFSDKNQTCLQQTEHNVCCSFCREAKDPQPAPCDRGLSDLELLNVTKLEFHLCASISPTMAWKALRDSGKCPKLKTLHFVTAGQLQRVEVDEPSHESLLSLMNITVTESKDSDRESAFYRAAEKDLENLAWILQHAPNVTLTINGFDNMSFDPLIGSTPVKHNRYRCPKV